MKKAPAMKAMKAMKVMKAMKAMKVMKAMKAMKKAMKAKKVSKIAKGKFARSLVFKGIKEKTKTGLQRQDLMKNRSGKIVSKKASAAAKKRYQGSQLQKWIKAVSTARKE